MVRRALENTLLVAEIAENTTSSEFSILRHGANLHDIEMPRRLHETSGQPISTECPDLLQS